jgi:hypothetical protein
MKELKDYFVTQEQAESLKELGFKDKCLASYSFDGDITFIPSIHSTETNAPLIAQTKDWLLDELGVLTTSFTIDEGIERLKALRKKLTTTFTLTFKVYDHTKTYEDGEYLIVKRNEHFPISVSIAYGQIVDSNGSSFDDSDVSYITPSFEVIHE